MTNWEKIVSRLSASSIADIDDVLFGENSNAAPEQTEGSGKTKESQAVNRVIWIDMLPEQRMFMSIVVEKPIDNAFCIASQLSAMALERSIEPIIFSRVGMCGLEQFGFRVEDTSQVNSVSSLSLEEQLRNFWNIDVQITMDQLSMLH